MNRFPVYTIVSIAFCLGVGAFGPAPRAAAACSSAIPGKSATVTLTDDALSGPIPDSYQPDPVKPTGLPVADVARPAGGSCDGQGGSGSPSASGASVAGRLSSPIVWPTPEFTCWATAPAPPFVRSGAPSEVFEPPRPRA